jgi:hypothetical protein
VRFFALSPYFSSWNRGSAGVALRHMDALLENEAFVPSQISLPCINTPIQMWKAPDTNEECPSRAHRYKCWSIYTGWWLTRVQMSQKTVCTRPPQTPVQILRFQPNTVKRGDFIPPPPLVLSNHSFFIFSKYFPLSFSSYLTPLFLLS